MKKTTIYTAFGSVLLFLNSCVTQQSTNTANSGSNFDLPPNAVPGKCYAKCLNPPILEEYTTQYIVYTGNEPIEKIGYEVKTIEVVPAHQIFEKQRIPDCYSTAEDGCISKVLVTKPAEFIKLKLLTDTTQTPNYEIRSIVAKRLVENASSQNWEEILCANKVTEKIINSIRTALSEKGYQFTSQQPQIDSEVKSALLDFQKKYNLPQGNLNLKTLEALGVE